MIKIPAFVNTPAKEKRWARAKEAAGKSTKVGSKGYYALSNFIFHRMGKTEYDNHMAGFYKKELFKTGLLKQFGGMMQLGEKSIPKMSGSMPKISTSTPKSPSAKITNVSGTKMPKAKKMADPFGKPSLYFKSEDIKHPSVRKLRDFLEHRNLKPRG